MQIKVTNQRNPNGVKNSCDQYRFIKGVHFACVSFGQINSAEIANGFKAQGARVRRIGDDVYVAAEDVRKIQ
jgi:hypothetical protein